MRVYHTYSLLSPTTRIPNMDLTPALRLSPLHVRPLFRNTEISLLANEAQDTSAGQAVNLSNLSTESANLNKPQLVSTIANQDWLSTHCVVCNARGHLVDDCPQSYHFYLKPGATITKVPLSEFPVRISCYKCASTQHLGDDCPTDPNPVKSVFSAAFYNQFLTEPLPEPNLDSAVLTERDITSGAPTSAPKTPRKVKQANNPPSKQLAQHQNQNQYPNQQNQSQQMQIQIHNLNLDQQSLNQNQQNQNRNAGMLGNHRVERAPPPPIAPFSPQYYPPGPPSWHYRR